MITDGVLELEPMDSYSRLLLHRLADIFGFSHESVGEGDDRHLVLERCSDTSIPSILVSDILWQYGEPQSSTTSHQLLRRKAAPPVLNTEIPSLEHSLEEREAAYLAARERIFATDARTAAEPVRHKPRSVPVVAQRMIAHALGQKVKTPDQDNVRDGKTCEQLANELSIQDNYQARLDSSSEPYQETTMLSVLNINSHDKAKQSNKNSSSSSRIENIVPQGTAEKSCNEASVSQCGRYKHSISKDYVKEEHLGAAKRMFAHALGLHSPKDGGFHLKSSETKQFESE